MSQRLLGPQWAGDPAFHGTEPAQAKQILLGSAGLMGMSTHGAAGSGLYVTGEESEAERYGDIVLRGHASASKVFTSDHPRYDRLSRHFNNPRNAPKVRDLLVKNGYDAVEDTTARDAVSLLHPGQFNVGHVFDPEVGFDMDAYSYIDHKYPEVAASRPRRRRARSQTQTVKPSEWAPETFGK